MKNILVAFVVAVLITIFFAICLKVITSDHYQNLALGFIFGLSFSLLLSLNFKKNNQNKIGQKIDSAVREVLKAEKRRSGLLVSVKACKNDKTVKKDPHGFVNMRWSDQKNE